MTYFLNINETGIVSLQITFSLFIVTQFFHNYFCKKMFQLVWKFHSFQTGVTKNDQWIYSRLNNVHCCKMGSKKISMFLISNASNNTDKENLSVLCNKPPSYVSVYFLIYLIKMPLSFNLGFTTTWKSLSFINTIYCFSKGL